MDQELRVPDALAKDLDSVFSTQDSSKPFVTSVPENLMTSSGLLGYQASDGVYTCMLIHFKYSYTLSKK